MSENKINRIYKCPNCGADIESDTAKCPFCGYINEKGAEKAYMEQLDDVRLRLDTVDEEAAAEYGKGYRRVLKIMAITLAVAAIVTVIAVILHNLISGGLKKRGNDSAEQTLQEMAWERENFPVFDEYYEAGDYEGLWNAVFSDEAMSHDVYKWKHSGFIYLYNRCRETEDELAAADKYGWDKYGASVVTYDCFYIYYGIYESGYEGLDADETDRLKPQLEYMTDVLYNRLKYTDEEMSALKERVIGKYGNLDYSECSKVAYEYMSRYE